MSARPRTLLDYEARPGVRKPSFEMQQMAMAEGYGSVRDWVLDQCVHEIRALKERVEALEDKGEVVE